MRFERSGVTGGIVEEELFGKSRYEEMTHINEGSFKFVSVPVIINQLRKMQPSDPTDPGRDFANTVHYYVFEELGIDAKDLRFYTSVKSPLDVFQGIDAWFETGDNGSMKMVTIDCTLNPKKDEHKADIIFLVPEGGLDRKVDKEQFVHYSKKLATEVVKFLGN
ncbi:MAG: hypothetical protein WCW47_01010 [Candidatus Paceibacterota bacterium]|jgi:hypothetical protein